MRKLDLFFLFLNFLFFISFVIIEAEIYGMKTYMEKFISDLKDFNKRKN
jgi:hypothetical protein